MIKFTDLYKLAPDKKKITNKINYLIRNNKFIGGDEVVKFEKEFSKFTGSKYCISVANGTDALFLSLKALNLPKNSEVIIPAMTYCATAFAVINAGLKPVLVDLEKNSPLIDLRLLKNKITKKTKVILPVHLYGSVVNLDSLRKIIINYKQKIYILDDCAQAHGAILNNKKKMVQIRIYHLSAFTLVKI